MYIFLLIQRYLSSYPHYILGISFYLSFNILIISLDIFLLIPRSPAIYPAGFLLRFRLVRLAAACRLCIALRKLLCFISATPGAALSRPGDPAAGPAGARRRRVRMAGCGPAPAPRRPVQWRRRRRRGLHWWPRRACRWKGERRWEGGRVARVWLGGDGYGDYGLDLDRPVRRNSRRSSSRLVNTSLKR